MGPSNFLINYDSTMRSMSSTSIPRKPKRYSKSSIAAMKYPQHKKGRMSSTCYFQKKVVIFRFMPAQPKSFTRSEKLILVTGLLPSLPIDASEKDIRGEICDVIKSTDEFKDVTPEDFEFINMCGKQGTIPQCKEGFEWNDRSVKELAGSGSVYVRLLRNFEVVSSGTDDKKFSDSGDLPYINIKPATTKALANSSASVYPSIGVLNSKDPNHSDFSSSYEMSSLSSATDSSIQGGSASSAIYIVDDNADFKEFHDCEKNSPVEDFTKLKEMFTSLSDKQLQYV